MFECPSRALAGLLFLSGMAYSYSQSDFEWLDLIPGTVQLDPFELSQAPQSFVDLDLFTWCRLGDRVYRSDGTLDGTTRTNVPAELFDDLDEPEASLVRPAASRVLELTDGRLLYSKPASSGDSQLAVSDGSLFGGEILPEVDVLSGSLGPAFANFQGEAWFLAPSGLWRTDGTLAGTLEEVQVSNAYSRAAIASSTDRLFVWGQTPSGIDLLVSDGTEAGTSVLTSLFGSLNSEDLAAVQAGEVGGRMVFTITGYNVISGLWSSDGTLAGTQQLLTTSGGEAAGMSFSSDRAFLSGFEIGLGGPQLASTDGTLAGTHQTPVLGLPRQGTVVGDRLLYPDPLGLGSWDGIANSTTLISSLSVQSPSPFELGLRERDGVGYFQTPSGGQSLLAQTDGSVAGTSLLPIVPTLFQESGSFGVTPQGPVRGFLEPVIADPLSPWDLIRLDVATQVWEPIATIAVPMALGGNLFEAARIQDRAFLSVEPNAPDAFWFSSDGTPAGTELLEEFETIGLGFLGGFQFPDLLYAEDFLDFGEEASYIADQGVFVLDVSSGESQELGVVNPTFLGRIGGKLLIGDVPPPPLGTIQGGRLWVSDGTPEGTQPLLPVGSPAPVSAFVPFGNELAFAGFSQGFATELWFTDGTELGTRQIDVVPGPGGSQVANLTRAGDRLFFGGADFAASGSLLYKFRIYVSDGTVAGTQQVSANTFPGIPGVRPGSIEAVGDRVVFAVEGDDGEEEDLWVTDGSTQGTVRLVDLNAAGGGLTLASAGDRVIFSRRILGTDQFQIWSTDGTPGGTNLVATVQSTLNSNAAGGIRMTALDLQGRVLFSAVDEAGLEPWVTDGTASGTRRLADLEPGQESSLLSPQGLNAVRVGSRILIEAQSAEFGAEVASLPLSSVGGFAVRELGEGCGATLGEPRLSAGGAGTTGGLFELEIENAFPGGFAAVFLGLEYRLPLGAGICSALIGDPIPIALGPVDSSGLAQFGLPIGGQPALVDQVIYFQGLAVELNGPFGGFATLTRALELAIGE